MSQNPFGDQLNLPRLEPPKIPAKTLGLVAGAALILLTISTSFFQVEPEEVGVIVRFGRFIKETKPGLHVKLPFFIDQVRFVPIQRQLSEEFGFQSRSSEQRRSAMRDPQGEANMLTGDLNAAVVEWVVQYRIVDPYNFLFKVVNIQDTFRDMSEAVMREVVGDRTVNEVLTVGRQDVTDQARLRLQELCDQYETGITVDQVVLQDVTPPDPVKPAFNEVNQAQQEKEKLINQAQAEYNQVIPRARGEAQQTISGARGYALDRVNRARGEAALFESVYAQYRKAPEVTRKRIYLETMGEVLPKAGHKVIVDDSLRGVLPLLNLDRRRKEGGS